VSKPKRMLKYFLFFFCIANVIAVYTSFIPTASATVLMQYPSDDAYVYNMNPTTNYGTEISLFVIAIGAPPTVVELSYLKFNISKFSGASIVKLYFTSGVVETGYSIHIAFWTSTTSWSESSVVWNTRPSSITRIGDLWISQSFTQYSINIKDYITGDVISIYLDPYYSADTKGLVQICSKEVGSTGWRPYISDDGTTPAPPSLLDSILPWIVIGLIAIAGISIGLIIYFKRNRRTPSIGAQAQSIPNVPISSVLPLKRFCIFCGSEIEQDATFCTHCGKQQRS